MLLPLLVAWCRGGTTNGSRSRLWAGQRHAGRWTWPLPQCAAGYRVPVRQHCIRTAASLTAVVLLPTGPLLVLAEALGASAVVGERAYHPTCTIDVYYHRYRAICTIERKQQGGTSPALSVSFRPRACRAPAAGPSVEEY